MTTTEQPRGSAAYHLQRRLTNDRINPDNIPTSCLALILTLLAPIHNKTAAVALSHHHDKQQRRLTLYIKDRPDMAPPAGNDTDPTDAGGLLSHTIEVS